MRGGWVMLVLTNRVSFSFRIVLILDHGCVNFGRIRLRGGL